MFAAKLKLLKSSFFISTFTTLSTLFAFAVQLVLAKQFGANADMDAYFAAIVVPAFLVKLLGNPLSTVFVPLYKDVKHNKSASEARHFYGSLFWGFMFLFLVIAVCIYLFSSQIAHLMIPGADSYTINLTSNLLHVGAVYVFFLGLYFTTQTLHIAKDSFFFPYLGNALSSLVMIIYTVLFIKEQGIYAPMYGLLYGAVTEAVVGIISLPESVKFIPKFNKNVYSSFFRLFIPLGVGSFIYKSTPLIDKYFASYLEKGDISVLSYGQKFLESINGFLAMGLSVVMLSMTSTHAAEKNDKDFASTMSWGLRATGLLIIPTCAYLLFFSPALIRALFERGNFTVKLSEQVGGTLIAYAGALLGIGLGAQLTNIFYAKRRHNLVVIINLLLIIPYIVLVHFLSRAYGVWGIALSYSILTVLTIIIYFVMSFKYLKSELRQITASYIKFLVSSVVMLIALLLFNSMPLPPMHSLIVISLQGVIGATVYGASLLALRAKEISPFMSYALNMLFPKKRKAV